MARTIVMSDLHGQIAPLTAALEHAGFGPDDALVVAGDLVDVGIEDAVGYAESLGAVILAGNHEVAAALGLRIAPQDPESLLRGPEFAEKFVTGAWKLAHVAENHLITHAGVSSALSDIISAHGEDLEGLADDLNARFAAEVEQAFANSPLTWEDLERYRLIGSNMGPLWFRPWSVAQLPSGIRQIVGHTPPELLPGDLPRALSSAGWLMVEPGGHGAPGGAHFRYALVENGVAAIIEG